MSNKEKMFAYLVIAVGIFLLTLPLIIFLPVQVSPNKGDVYGHVNPGKSIDPYQPNRPFVALYMIEEVKDDEFKSSWKVMDIDGKVLEYEQWLPFYYLKYDEKLKDGGTEKFKDF